MAIPHGRQALFQATLLGLIAVVAPPSPVHAFALYRNVVGAGGVDVRESVLQAPRWAAEPIGGTGLHDRIQVGVQPDFALLLGASPDQVPLVREAVVAAFDAWSNDVLAFDVTFDADRFSGDFEILLGTFEGGTGFDDEFGHATFEDFWMDDRLLTNGQRHEGWLIFEAEIEINAANVRWFRQEYESILTDEGLLAALQRLVMHEAGHTLGLDHSTIAPFNFDTDDDPYDAMTIDPAAPWTDLHVAAAVDEDCIMSGLAYGSSFEALFHTALHGDDAGGRDALYPVPMPEPGGTVGVALLGALFAAASARRPAPPGQR